MFKKFIKDTRNVLILTTLIAIAFPIAVMTPSNYGVIPKETGLQLIGYGGSILGGFLTLYGVWWTIKDQERKSNIVLENQNMPIIKYSSSYSDMWYDQATNLVPIGDKSGWFYYIGITLSPDKDYDLDPFLDAFDIKFENKNTQPISLIDLSCVNWEFCYYSDLPKKVDSINNNCKRNDTKEKIHYRIPKEGTITLKVLPIFSFRLYNFLSKNVDNEEVMNDFYYIMADFEALWITDYNVKYAQTFTLTIRHFYKNSIHHLRPVVTSVDGLRKIK